MEKRVFFSGLNELRAIAALAVVFHHIELFKQRDGFPSLYDTSMRHFIATAGANGVDLFFVLSGFLITFLLLTELEDTGSINVKKFYTRRALRIAPLYYFLVLICFFVLPVLVLNHNFPEKTFYVMLIHSLGEDFVSRLVLFLIFLPNLALVLFKPVAGLSQSWSVGVEEQFYLFWPLILKYFKGSLLPVLTAIIILKLGGLYALGHPGAASRIPYYDAIINFLRLFKIELMATGGIGAYFLFHYRDRCTSSKWFKRRYAVGIAIAAVIGMFCQTHYMFLGVLYILLILLCSQEKSNILRNTYLASLGKVSYGIYMYHPLMIFFTFSILGSFGFFNFSSLPTNIAVYFLVLSATFITSYLSYYFLELPFLRLKRRFSLVKSGGEL